MNDLEKEYVYDTYNLIAQHFNNTRHYVWPNIKEFIDSQDPGSLIADIGCGNGKNMYRKDCEMIGLDFCDKFVEICKSKKKHVVLGNCIKLPFSDQIFDVTLSVAVLHHLSTKERRQKALDELIRITKPGGKILVQVWGFESGKSDKQDAKIHWNLQKKYSDHKENVIIDRYYYLFKGDELKQMIPEDKVKIIKYYTTHDNWVAELQRF